MKKLRRTCSCQKEEELLVMRAIYFAFTVSGLPGRRPRQIRLQSNFIYLHLSSALYKVRLLKKEGARPQTMANKILRKSVTNAKKSLSWVLTQLGLTK